MSQEPQSSGSTPIRTPAASRTYLTAGYSIHQSPRNNNNNSPSHSQGLHEASLSSEERNYIYGTNIDTEEIQGNLEKFISEFDAVVDNCSQETHKKYLDDLKNLAREESSNVLEVDALHIKEFDREMYYQLVYFPAEMITAFDHTVKVMFERMFVEPETNPDLIARKRLKKENLFVNIVGLQELTKLMDLEPKHLNRLIAFRGIVIRCSDLHPEMKTATFRCARCGWETMISLENARVEEPKSCSGCHDKLSMEIEHNLSQFTNKQFVKLQELPEYVPEGETPNSIQIVAYDSNVDQVKPGDRVEVVGIYRAQGKRLVKSRRNVQSLFNTYVDMISSKVIADNRFSNNVDEQKVIFDDEQKRRFFDMAEQPGIIDRLVSSFAPSLFGNEDVKRGILCQLFSGCQKQFSQSGRGRFRSDINVCLVGDPSTAKSQMLQQVYKIAPRGIYTSGKGSSAVGLTANVRKDPETGEYILESGALVLSDRGICCIDEFDKMDENSKTILLEVMEQQTISVAKAGIVCSLNSRTSILAAANPVNSRYNPRKSVVENINLPPALLSRFDLIYIMLDKPNEAYDTKLARHILSLYSKKQDDKDKQQLVPYSRAELTSYITFARQEYFPQLTEEACDKLSRAYVDMRKIGSDKKTVTATPRQLESMIRLSEAFAKMRLSTEVQGQDVDNAIDLIRSALLQAAVDPSTGLIDMDLIVTGRTTAMRARINQISEAIREHIQANVAQYRKGLAFDAVAKEIKQLIAADKSEQPGQPGAPKEKFTAAELREALQVLATQGTVNLYGKVHDKPSVRVGKDLFGDK